jgi:hypothetical protein
MSENNEVVEAVETEAAPAGDNVQISVEQICAAIISTIGSVDVPVEKLLANYQDKSISVNQNEETKVLTFTLIDNSEIAPEAEKE